jgi:hypothetical protein
VFERAADRLRRFDDHAQEEYLAQFKCHMPSQYTVEIPARVIPGPLIRSVFQGGSASLVLSWPAGDRRPQFPLVPPIGAPRPGRIKGGSPTGLILGVLAEECRRRFEAPGWREILKVCLAVAPETFDTEFDTVERQVERLRKRVERVSEDQITILFRHLFPAD